MQTVAIFQLYCGI